MVEAWKGEERAGRLRIAGEDRPGRGVKIHAFPEHLEKAVDELKEWKAEQLAELLLTQEKAP